MIKVHYDSDQEALFRACDGRMFQIFEDLHQMRKCASSMLFTASDLDAVRPDKDHFLIHNVLVGDEETYGQNRNGDAFPKKACREHVGTFVTHGSNYREHRNRSKKESLGPIKLAGVHPRLRRIEIVGWWNKKAAEEEYELAKAGKALSFSMSCRVPNDRCNCCGNLAKRASEYCDHLALHMNRYLPEFQKYAYAINDRPTFYDNSRVRAPADRIAHFLEYRFHEDDMAKAAAAGRVITGADWAEYEGVDIPDPAEAICFDCAHAAILQKLAAQETWISELPADAALTDKVAFVRQVGPRLFPEHLSQAALDKFRTIQPGTLFRAMAKRAAILPFLEFAAYALGTSLDDTRKSPEVKTAAVVYLPQVFRDMLKAGNNSIGSLFEAAPEFVAACDSNMDDDVQGFMDQVESQFGIQTDRVKRRALMAEEPNTHDDESVKASSVDSSAAALAEAYGHYQLRALHDMEVLRGEPVSEIQCLITAAANRHVYR